MSPALLKPPQLQPDSTIGVFSPSWPAAGLFPHRVARARYNLDRHGYVLKLAPNALYVTGHTAGSAAERAADLHDLFCDPEVKAIMAAIGGDNSNELLPHLDWDLIRAHPKILVGYSDATVLLNVVHVRTGLVTFHGPMLVTQWGEHPEILNFTVRWFQRVLGQDRAAGRLDQPENYTDEFLDWGLRADAQRPRRLRSTPSWRWLRPGRANGPLLGGHLSTFHLLAGTPNWPDLRGAILFWEAVWGEESLAQVHRYLTALANLGVFDQISGMVIALPDGMDSAAVDGVDAFLTAYFGRWQFPVLFGPCFGHLDPMLTLPIGILATLDSATNRFSLDEAAVSQGEASDGQSDSAALLGVTTALLDIPSLAPQLGKAEMAILRAWVQARLEDGEDAEGVLAMVRRLNLTVGQRADMRSTDRLQWLMRLLGETESVAD